MPLLSRKELEIVGEQIQLEDLGIAKCQHYLGFTEDPDVVKLLEAMAIKHQEHHDILLKHLRPNG